jgi:membrane-bound metal-dependent hydrolase YbcI (DUF457 family)
MPLAVTHILVPMVLVDFIRDHGFKKHRRMWPNKYIFLVGIAGLLPDIDMPISIFLTGDTYLHRTFTHTIWFPLLFLLIFVVSYKFFKIAKILKFNIWKASFMIFVGITIHLILDATLAGTVNLLYPLNQAQFGLNLVPESWVWFYSSLDAILLFGWLVHEEMEHNISEYF